tara:strand:+ start:272 stop:403 length:132 start_codon:yes stop_codon:yes gene_type:complete
MINQSTDGKENGNDVGTNHRSCDGESAGGANGGTEQSSNTKLD